MDNKFKLYKSIDYCKDSNTFLLIKSSVIYAWEQICNKYTKGKQLYRVRYYSITPKTKIEDLLMYSCDKSTFHKEQFINHLKYALEFAFPGFKFHRPFLDGFYLTNKTTLLQLYNSLIKYNINKLIVIEDEKKLHEEYKKKYT